MAALLRRACWGIDSTPVLEAKDNMDDPKNEASGEISQ
jgi:hypothetical protein